MVADWHHSRTNSVRNDQQNAATRANAHFCTTSRLVGVVDFSLIVELRTALVVGNIVRRVLYIIREEDARISKARSSSSLHSILESTVISHADAPFDKQMRTVSDSLRWRMRIFG